MKGPLDRDDTTKPVLLVDQDGVIRKANKAAVRVWDSPVGQPCATTVRATDGEGRAVCFEGCPRGAANRDARRSEVHVRGQVGTLHCTSLGDVVIVSMERLAPATGTLSKLTPREREVLALVAKGLSTSAVAESLGLRPCTARTHMERCRTKLGARTQAEAVARAIATHQLDVHRD